MLILKPTLYKLQKQKFGVVWVILLPDLLLFPGQPIGMFTGEATPFVDMTYYN